MAHDSLEITIARKVLRLAEQIAPMLPQNVGRDQVAGTALSEVEAVQILRQRLLDLGRGLTARELDVCARALVGMTAEGTALDLNLKKTSVETYRRRAYARLGISSCYQLFRMLIT
jgi:DNA-binding CsgD family transcriptional regulator